MLKLGMQQQLLKPASYLKVSWREYNFKLFEVIASKSDYIF